MTTQPHMKTDDEIVEKIEVIINRHSPMENFEVKEQCAREIAEQIVHQQRKEILEAIEGIRPNKDGKGLSVFADSQHPFIYTEGSVKGDRDRKLFAMGYLQAKRDILQTLQKEV